jgi:hypothetical protein
LYRDSEPAAGVLVKPRFGVRRSKWESGEIKV